MTTITSPDPFFEVRVHDVDAAPGLTGLCVGYELGTWRSSQLARHAMEWLPEFALKHSELASLTSGNSVQLVREAANRVYHSKKFERRGEFGELFLHAAIRQVFGSLPAISKIYYKSASNDTVKGFDAVHVVPASGELQLWLGEAKFYSDIDAAIRDVAADLAQHTTTDYLRSEFLLIKGKIDPSWPHARELSELLSENKSLDHLFKRACLAVLLTYDSNCVRQHQRCDDSYQKAFVEEIQKHYSSFSRNHLPRHVTVHLFLLPLHAKQELLVELDTRLRAAQAI